MARRPDVAQMVEGRWCADMALGFRWRVYDDEYGCNDVIGQMDFA